MNSYNEAPVLKLNPKTLEEIITRVAFKNTEALAELYEHTKFAIYGFALSVLKNHSDAKMVLHNTYLSIWASSYMYAFAGKPMQWLIMIAQSHCFKVLRNRKWNDNTSAVDNDAKLTCFMLTAEEKSVLDTFLNTLEDDEREIIILSLLAGYKTMDIAYFLNIPFLKVVSMRNKALKKLKKNCKMEAALNGSKVNVNFLKGIIKTAVEKTTPDVWSNIAFDTANQKGDVITKSDKKPKGRVFSFVKTILAFLVVLSLTLFGITNYNRADLKSVSTVSIENEPQIEISLNVYNVVLEATSKTKEGQALLNKIKFNETLLDEALDKILIAMVEDGYFKGKADEVFVTVKHNNPKKVEDTQRKVKDYISNNKALRDFEFIAEVNPAPNTEKPLETTKR